jgi:PKD repeat protein
VGIDESIDAFSGQQLVSTQDISLGIILSKVGPTVFNPDATGSAFCMGLELIPGFSVGIYNCHTVVNLVGISDTNGELQHITGNPMPVADANGPYGGIAGEAVQFDGSASFDMDGTIVSYEWDFGDNTTGTGINPTHTYALAGTYTISLTVTDNAGATDTATTFVTIREEACEDHTDCTDDNLCNGEETCENGICMPGLPIICSDTEPCTADSCDASDGCIFTPIDDCTTGGGVCVDHGECSDDNLCNGEETCQYEICMPGTPLICYDADPCTFDSCDPATGCVNTPIGDGGACDDADACTANDLCTEGSCVGTAVDCDDAETCTYDTCYPVTGCINYPVLDGTKCNDGNDCTENDACSTGSCVGDNVSDGAPCNDSKFCTETSSCQEGFCEGSGNPCESLQLVCNEAEEGCECVEDEECDDGLYCNGEEVCQIKFSEQVCQPAIADSCPQDHICDERKDTCVSFQFCNTDDDCDDGRFCNGQEICFHTLGTVQGNRSVPMAVCRQATDPCAELDLCDEGNDICLECLEDTDCHDESFCNGQETCIDGSCQEGNSPCLPEEVCDEEAGVCLVCLTDEDCNDELFCNGEEICLDGNCQSGTNPCSNEICDEENDVCVPQPLPLSFQLTPQSAFCSHLIPLPLFMVIVSDDTDFDSTTTVSFSDDVLTPPLTLVSPPKLIIVFSMIAPVGIDNSEAVEVEVIVTTTEGEGREKLSLIPLPGVLGN